MLTQETTAPILVMFCFFSRGNKFGVIYVDVWDVLPGWLAGDVGNV